MGHVTGSGGAYQDGPGEDVDLEQELDVAEELAAAADFLADDLTGAGGSADRHRQLRAVLRGLLGAAVRAILDVAAETDGRVDLLEHEVRELNRQLAALTAAKAGGGA